MPIIITFDVQDGDNNQRNRVQELFEKLGWQSLGGSSYRYPKLGSHLSHPAEDWLNHVIPALMLFRRYVMSGPRVTLTSFTLDAQASTGCDVASQAGPSPKVMTSEDLYLTPHNKFTVTNLLAWLNAQDYPYP